MVTSGVPMAASPSSRVYTPMAAGCLSSPPETTTDSQHCGVGADVGAKVSPATVGPVVVGASETQPRLMAKSDDHVWLTETRQPQAPAGQDAPLSEVLAIPPRPTL